MKHPSYEWAGSVASTALIVAVAWLGVYCGSSGPCGDRNTCVNDRECAVTARCELGCCTPDRGDPRVDVSGSDRTAAEGGRAILRAAADDDEGSVNLTYRWTVVDAPDGVSVTIMNAEQAEASFVPSSSGTYRFRVEVTDRDGNVTIAEVVVRVVVASCVGAAACIDANDCETGFVCGTDGCCASSDSAPQVDAGPDVVTNAGQTVVLSATGQDDGGVSNLAFEWQLLFGPDTTVQIANADSAEASFVAPSTPGDYVFRVEVRDAAGGVAFDDVVVTVSEQVCETDADFCVRNNSVCGQLTAIDDCGESRTVASCGTCTPAVQRCASNRCVANSPPAISDLSAVGTGLVQTWSVSCAAGDADGDPLTYTYSASAGTIVSDGPTAAWTPPAVEGQHIITCSVEDAAGAVVARSTTVSLAVADGLLGHWSFDGNAVDISGNDNNGTVVGTVQYQQGRFGQAIVLDGAARVDVDNESVFDLGVVSITAWVRAAPSNTARVIVAKPRVGGFGNFNFEINEDDHPFFPGRLSYVHDTAGGNYSSVLSNEPIVSGEFVHVAVVMNGNQIRSFVNGVRIRTSNAVTPPVFNDNPVRIGAGSFGTFVGAIDEVRIYGRLLEDVEVEAIANAQ